MDQKPEFQFGSAFEDEEKLGLASPLDRLAAIVVDILFLLPLVQVIQSPFKRELLKSLAFEDVSAAASWRMLNLGVLLFVFWIYNTLSIYFFSQTLGKRIFGIKVVSFNKHVSLYASAVRSVSFFIECGLMGLPFIALFIHPWRRPYHDRMSDTLVVSLKKPVSYPGANEKRKAYAFTACFLLAMTLSSAFYTAVGSGENLMGIVSEIERKECDEFSAGENASVENAIKNYAIKNIGTECLKELAKKALWKNEDKALANLASSFAYHEQEMLSFEYLNQVCKEEGSGRACQFSSWVKSNPIDNDPKINEIKDMLIGSQVADFYKIYFISALQSHNLHKEAQEVIAQVDDGDEITGFLSLATFKALLWENKWESAYWIYKTNNISDNAFVDFIEGSHTSERLSSKELMGAMEQFYPGLKAQSGRHPASLSSIPVKIRGLWMRLKEESR